MKHVSRLIAAWLLLLAMPAPGLAASPAPVVVFTVDVESNDAFHLPDQLNATCSDGVACGLTEIVRQLRDRQWAGTFFLNVYEHRQWGDAAMRRIATELQASGQEVGLHTHPDWAYDPARSAMHAYTLDEQSAIVGDGVRLLQEWTGHPVVSHRTGAYAADDRTLTALERNNIRVDSSVFWRIPASRLDTLGLPRNQPSYRGHLLEIPVTVYERQDRPAVLGRLFAPVSVIRKIDPDWFINEAEMRAAIDASLESKVQVLVVFLHSFSFMDVGPGGAPQADRHAMRLFAALLDYVALKKLPVATMRDLATGATPFAVSADADRVPLVTVRLGMAQYAWHRAKALDRRTASAALAFGVALVIGCAWMVARRVRVRRRTRAGRAIAAAVPTSRAVQFR